MIKYKNENYITIRDYIEGGNEIGKSAEMFDPLFRVCRFVSIDDGKVCYMYRNRQLMYHDDWEDTYIKIYNI